jgi:hypothetical protein
MLRFDGFNKKQFCKCLHQHTADEFVLHNILWTDDEWFNREDVFNVHKSHLLAQENTIRELRGEDHFRVSVWAWIVRDIVVGPYLQPDSQIAQSYRYHLENVVPGLLEDVPLAVR